MGVGMARLGDDVEEWGQNASTIVGGRAVKGLG